MEFVSQNLEETKKIASNFVKNLTPKGGALLSGLYGDLGAGKTSFIQGVAEALGVKVPVSSPTFVLEKRYELANKPFKYLVHIDAYRIDDPSELLRLGWEELLADPANIIFLEWPERVVNILPKDMQKIRMEFVDENKRNINIEG